jgi:glycosyltransferase involved in cell wall biosynthesis
LTILDSGDANLVSIIVPAYNAEHFIVDTLNSVIKQSYSNWELIIINDGSTDATALKVEPFLKDSRIQIHSKTNEGVSKTRNIGIALAKGNYIAFLDADDSWECNNLELKIKTLQENKNIDWVFSDMYNADVSLNLIGIAAPGNDNNILESILLWEREVIPGPCSNLVITKKCKEAGILFDTNISSAADQDFCLQLAKQFNAKRIPLPLWSYRIIESSMSRNIMLMEKDHIYVYKKAKKKQLFKSFWFKQRCFSNLYFNLAGSWWKEGNNKKRGIYFLIKGLLYNPFNIMKLLYKFYK